MEASDIGSDERILKIFFCVLRMYFLLWHFHKRLEKLPNLGSSFHSLLAAKLQFFDCNTRLILDLLGFHNLIECIKKKTLFISKDLTI